MALSHSGLTLYQQCPSAFNRRYNLKEVTPDHPPALALVRGTNIHKHLEDFLNGDIEKLDPDLLKWDTMMTTLRAHRATAEMEFGLTEDYSPCGFDDEEAFLRGKIDAAWYDVASCTAHVYEWKTGKKYPEHAAQRQLYALAAMAMYPDAKLVIINTPYLDAGSITKEEFTPANKLTLMWSFTRKVNKTRPPQPYHARPSWKCNFCEYNKKAGGTCAI